MQQLLGRCSPYIHTYLYDIDDRSVIIEFIGNIEDPKPHTRLVFTEVQSFQEQYQLDEFDDENLDDLVDLSRARIDGKAAFVLTSYKKTITLVTDCEPFTEAV